jgi:selenophosphate synthetase-related protein
MLLEMSEKGAVIELDAIPRPDLKAHGISFEHWVRMYPGMGFVLTSRPGNVKEVCRRFASVGMTARPIGRVDGDRNLCIEYGGEQTSVFDLKKESVMGIVTNPCELTL